MILASLDAGIQNVFDRAVGLLEAKGIEYPAVRREALTAALLSAVLMAAASILMPPHFHSIIVIAGVCTILCPVYAKDWRLWNARSKNWTDIDAKNAASDALWRREALLLQRHAFLALLIVSGGTMLLLAGRNGLGNTIAGSATTLWLLAAWANAYIESSAPLPPKQHSRAGVLGHA